LLRRDFTINALAYDAISNTLIDTVGGLDDINNRIIRAVGNPETRFNEDRLRMLRAIRFATVLGFSIEDNTLAAISSGRSFIHMVAWERIREEFSRILTSHSPSRGLEMMRVTGILGEILPELPTGTEQVCRECGSGTVYEHSLMVCDRVSNDISLRLAALLHEIEQWAEMENCTYDVNDANDMDNVDDADDGNDRDDSPKKSAELALNVLTRYRFPSAVINKVCLLIKFHTTGYSGEWTDGDVRRFVSRIGRNNIDDFFKFKKADFLAQECQGKEGLRSFYEFEKRIRMLVDDATVLTVEGLDIDGHDLRQIGFEEGPVIGEMLKLALDLVIESPEKNRKDVLMNYIANHIKNIKKAGEDQS
jgi:tRNA nucleotidyltransferase/poly(A) polymerase